MNTLKLASRMNHLSASPIREILKAIDKPGMISFAGGLPAAESFPQFDGDIPQKYLQYGPSEGEPKLREIVAEKMRKLGLCCCMDQVLILAGSQQGIDLVAKLLIEENARIAIETPTYLAALQTFNLFNPDYQNLTEIDASTRLTYTIPTFQNPTGKCYTKDERLALANQCDRYDTILFEDDPYGDLYFDDACRTPICSMLDSANWVYQGSFSKILSPGLRLGYLVCSKPLMPYLTRLKQAADLHSSRISQFLVLQSLTDSSHQQRLESLRAVYRAKRDFFNAELQKHFGNKAIWRSHSGGLFFWISIRKCSSDNEDTYFENAIKRNVAFMPGKYFYPNGLATDNPYDNHSEIHMRLNFSYATQTEVSAGIPVLASIFS